MRSLRRFAVVGVVVLAAAGSLASPLPSLPPAITPAPSVEEVEGLIRRIDLDAISLAQILLTAVPFSLRQIAATNIPAASNVIRDEFSLDKRPDWFNELSEEIQAYLISKFGPPTARPTPPPVTSASASASASEIGSESLSATATGWPGETSSTPSPSQSPSDEVSGVATSVWQSTAWTASSGTTVSTSARSSSTRSSVTSHTSSSSHKSSSTQIRSSSASSSSSSSSPSSTTLDPSSTPDAPPVAGSTSGLTKSQKVGLGVGIPIGILGVAAVFFASCFLLRRRRKKDITGSIPPSSPGFIPRFAFHDRTAENVEHQTPLTRHLNNSTQDLGQTNWEDDGVDAIDAAPMHNPYTMNSAYPESNAFGSNNPYAPKNNGAVSYSNIGAPINDPAPIHYTPDAEMTMHDPTPIAAFHTHSSNRARGFRTSYTSLRSVAEVSEPDEQESPVLGRKQSGPRTLIPAAAVPAGARIKRKPVGSPPSPVPTSPAVEASQELLRPTLAEQSASSSSGLASTTSTATGNSSTSSGFGVHPDVSPISPSNPDRISTNPFSYDSYMEDYGPEWHSGYVDLEDGLYGNTSLSRYPSPKTPKRKSSKTEWPLRSMIGSGNRRKSSPLWNRIYEE